MLEEQKHCCEIEEPALRDVAGAKKIIELAKKIPGYGKKSLTLSHQISFTAWHGQSDRQKQATEKLTVQERMPHGYAVQGTPGIRFQHLNSPEKENVLKWLIPERAPVFDIV